MIWIVVDSVAVDVAVDVDPVRAWEDSGRVRWRWHWPGKKKKKGVLDFGRGRVVIGSLGFGFGAKPCRSQC